MGATMASSLDRAGEFGRALTGRRSHRVLMLGLDAAGKSTMLWKLRNGKVETAVPTIGFNVETTEMFGREGRLEVTSWDVGGRDKIRPLWRHYYENTKGIIFVVDGNDRERIEQARDQLQEMLAEDQLQGLPLLVLANKQDLPNSMGCTELSEQLGLCAPRGRRRWHIQGCVATSGHGLQEGLSWLRQALTQDAVEDRGAADSAEGSGRESSGAKHAPPLAEPVGRMAWLGA